MEEKKCLVDFRLLPIKAHYFFFLGAMGGVKPFIQVVAKELGLNATAVGIIFTMLPVCVCFSKPAFGFIVDYFKNIKIVVFIMVAVTAVTYISAAFVPAIDNTYWTSVVVDRCKNASELRLEPPPLSDSKCLREGLKREAHCEFDYTPCGSGIRVDLSGVLSIYHTIESFKKGSSMNENSSSINSTLLLRLKPDRANFTCDSCITSSNSFRCASPMISACMNLEKEEGHVYKTIEFWLFTLFAVISGTGASTIFCLSDAACYEVLGDQPENFGRQRLWGTISWGSVTFLAGLLNDLATGNSEVKSYKPGFYLMFFLLVIDLILLSKIKLTKTKYSLHFCQDIGKIFSSCEAVAFAAAVYIIGALTGILWNYEFWYLQDLGASQTLWGVTVAVQCMVAEVPFFFFSGWFIKTFGYFYCLTCVFIAFTLRFGFYVLLQDPWFVLPIEVLHGVTFAVFYSSMTGYAANCAPPGTEATMMGILGGLFGGLGVATGSLLGGVGFDKLGNRKTFFVAGIISVICAAAFTLVHVVIKRLTHGPKGPSINDDTLQGGRGVHAVVTLSDKAVVGGFKKRNIACIT